MQKILNQSVFVFRQGSDLEIFICLFVALWPRQLYSCVKTLGRPSNFTSDLKLFRFCRLARKQHIPRQVANPQMQVVYRNCNKTIIDGTIQVYNLKRQLRNSLMFALSHLSIACMEDFKSRVEPSPDHHQLVLPHPYVKKIRSVLKKVRVRNILKVWTSLETPTVPKVGTQSPLRNL